MRGRTYVGIIVFSYLGINNTQAVIEKSCLGEQIMFKGDPWLGGFEPAFSDYVIFSPLLAKKGIKWHLFKYTNNCRIL